jgi:hypothetical protein
MVYNFELNHALSLVRSEVLNLALYSRSCSYSVIFLYLSRQFKHGALDTGPPVISDIRRLQKSTTRVNMTQLRGFIFQNFRRIYGTFSFLCHVDFLLIGFHYFLKRWPDYKIVSVEITNKMQPCNRIYYSKVYWMLHMFRAAHRSSSGALNCICSLWFIYPCGDRPLSRLSGKWISHFPLSLDNGQSPHGYVKPEAANTV